MSLILLISISGCVQKKQIVKSKIVEVKVPVLVELDYKLTEAVPHYIYTDSDRSIHKICEIGFRIEAIKLNMCNSKLANIRKITNTVNKNKNIE